MYVFWSTNIGAPPLPPLTAGVVVAAVIRLGNGECDCVDLLGERGSGNMDIVVVAACGAAAAVVAATEPTCVKSIGEWHVPVTAVLETAAGYTSGGGSDSWNERGRGAYTDVFAVTAVATDGAVAIDGGLELTRFVVGVMTMGLPFGSSA